MEPPPTRSATGLALACAFIVAAVSSLDNNAVSTALPAAAGELGGLQDIGGVITAYLLAATVTAPVYGKASDVFGRRPVLTAALLLFVMGALLCSLARSMPELIAFRALQGAGAGGLFTTALTLIADATTPRERISKQAIIVNAVAICQFIGPLLGGLLTEHFSWRAVFWVNPPMGALALVILWTAPLGGAAQPGERFNAWGAFFFMLFASLVLLALSHARDGLAIWGPFVLAAAAAGVLWRVNEVRSKSAIIATEAFAARSYTLGISVLTALAFALQGTMAFTPFFLQTALGLTPTESGLALLAQIAGMSASNFLMARSAAMQRTPVRLILVAIAGECVGLIAFAAAAAMNAPLPYFLAALFIRGLGIGVSIPALMALAQNAAPQTALGAATATMMFTRSVGGVIGVTATGILIAGFVGDSAPMAPTFQTTLIAVFALHAIVTAIAFAVAAALLPRTSA